MVSVRKKRRILCTVLVLLLAVAALAGCNLLSEEKIKLRDLEMTVLSEDKIPEELKTIIDEKKSQPFQLTYKDNGNLYICIGYGEQSTGGYSVVVNELYLTDSSIYVNTSLLGPDTANRDNPVASYPFIVIKTELLEQPVIFE
ncbi:MAG: protease complex subunit PrcB family protein [Roseburia sp.]|nr:protease complex subunit PrcB family protein [Roseburia sp.]